MRVIPSKNFEKKVVKLSMPIKSAVVERLRLFAEDQFHALLNNHALHGQQKHFRSINITGDYRLIYEQYDADTVRLIDIDTHSNLYGA